MLQGSPFFFGRGESWPLFLKSVQQADSWKSWKSVKQFLTNCLPWKIASRGWNPGWRNFTTSWSINERSKSIIGLNKPRRFWAKLVLRFGNGVASAGSGQKKVRPAAARKRNGGFRTR